MTTSARCTAKRNGAKWKSENNAMKRTQIFNAPKLKLIARNVISINSSVKISTRVRDAKLLHNRPSGIEPAQVANHSQVATGLDDGTCGSTQFRSLALSFCWQPYACHPLLKEL